MKSKKQEVHWFKTMGIHCPWCGAKYRFPLGREMKMTFCMKCHGDWIGEIENKD